MAMRRVGEVLLKVSARAPARCSVRGGVFADFARFRSPLQRPAIPAARPTHRNASHCITLKLPPDPHGGLQTTHHHRLTPRITTGAPVRVMHTRPPVPECTVPAPQLNV